MFRRIVFGLDSQLNSRRDKGTLIFRQREILRGQQVKLMEAIVSDIRFTIASIY